MAVATTQVATGRRDHPGITFPCVRRAGLEPAMPKGHGATTRCTGRCATDACAAALGPAPSPTWSLQLAGRRSRDRVRLLPDAVHC